MRDYSMGIMGFTGDNLKGFILALLSSAFIGASFIIKKKGLRKAAAASGVRAGNTLLPTVCCVCVVLGNLEVMIFFSSILCVMCVSCRNLIGVGGYAYLMEPLWWLGMITSTSDFPHLYLSIFLFDNFQVFISVVTHPIM